MVKPFALKAGKYHKPTSFMVKHNALKTHVLSHILSHVTYVAVFKPINWIMTVTVQSQLALSFEFFSTWQKYLITHSTLMCMWSKLNQRVASKCCHAESFVGVGTKLKVYHYLPQQQKLSCILDDWTVAWFLVPGPCITLSSNNIYYMI